ncbi:hypothetical protein GHT40_04575 [Citrobacter werkmanii]|uniref:hypothetical protein n=1 Tax=Citrobacter werkmanii TaxID=67827 RepID=UPI00190201B8|nr:hypothetical protein [Citrobacter werkmanii]MBJ9293569.1 hypothetical protein [Citrobacter werkmanii]
MTSKQALGLTMNELAEANAEHVTTISKLEQKLTDMAVQLANAESKCRELGAENVTLNDKMNKLATWPGIEFYSSAWEFCNLDGNDALEFMCDVQTPATDSFMAEVRAQGVDFVCDYHKSRCEALHDVDRNGSHRHGAALCDAIDIAAQLRKGVQS